MATVTPKSTRLDGLGLGAFAVNVAALAFSAWTFGAGTASADPNDPAMTEVGGDGVVNSRQAASIAGADYCTVSPGTLGTAGIVASDVGTPTQKAEESGPEWVGSRGWQAIGLAPSNPWGGAFDPRNTSTGPQCGPGDADGF